MYASTHDVSYRQRLIPARQALGNLYEDRGGSPAAIQQYRIAVTHADALAAIEPNNTQWLDYGYHARGDLAGALLNANQPADAARQTQLLCNSVQSLLRRDASNPGSRRGLVMCLLLQARIAARTGSTDAAARLSQRAVEIAKSVHTDDRVADGYLVAAAYRGLGDVQRQAGNADLASASWATGLEAIPKAIAEQPYEMAERAKILSRLGRTQDAMSLAKKLQAGGYQLRN
jgi:tetratricopeptide (TPR) repeat protein